MDLQWTNLALPLSAIGLVPDGFNMTYISALSVDPHQKGHVFAGRAAPGRGASNGIFHSIDSGETWTNISSGFSESMFVWTLHFDQYESVLYAGTDLGLIKLKAGNPGD